MRVSIGKEELNNIAENVKELKTLERFSGLVAVNFEPELEVELTEDCFMKTFKHVDFESAEWEDHLIKLSITYNNVRFYCLVKQESYASYFFS